MHTHRLVPALVVLLSMVPNGHVHGQQERASTPQVWLSLGGSTWGSAGAAIAQLSVQHSIVTVQARFVGEPLTEYTPIQSDLALLAGLATPAFNAAYFRASLTAGIARTSLDAPSYTDCSVEFCPESPGPALALNFQVAWRPASFLGIGLFGYANLNSVDSFGGSGLRLELGKLR